MYPPFSSETPVIFKLKDTDIRLPGRLLGKTDPYIELGASQYIVNTIADGYKLVFTNTPPPLLI